ncbi:MAG: hypothetical protein WD176_06850, partial [Pirellulales bacterium]
IDWGILQRNLGAASGRTAFDGDMNGDGAVGRTDAALFAMVYGRATAPAPPAPSPSAPAPSVLTARPTRAKMAPTPIAVDTVLAAPDELRIARGALRRSGLHSRGRT